MNLQEQKEITIKRDFYVVKDNRLIQKSRYDLSLTEQRGVAYICSMIKPVKPSSATCSAPYQLEYEFNILEYAKICGLYYTDGGKLYEEIRDLLKRLMQKIIHVELPDGDEMMIAWLSKVYFSKRNGIAKIEISKDMAPFLFDLQEKFTIYGLLNILAMKSRYSVRIYELVRSHAYQKIIAYEIERLKELLMVDGVKSYVRFPDFRRYVLDPAMTEINRYTDLQVSYDAITKGRKVTKIQFTIDKKPYLDQFIALTNTTKEIEKT